MVKEVSEVSARWLYLKVRDGDETDFRITLPWFLCSGILGLGEWVIRLIPDARDAIQKEVPGGFGSVDEVIGAIRRMPPGTRIEVEDNDSHVLIECR